MNILQVIPYFAWEYGGPVRFVHDLSKELKEMGHEVTICTTDVGVKNPLVDSDKLKITGVNILYFKCLNNKIGNNLKLHFSPQMRVFFKKNLPKFDIVHLHEFRSIPNVYLQYYAKKYGVPYIIQPHGSLPLIIGNQDHGRTLSKRTFDIIFTKKIIGNASRVVALNKNEFTTYKTIGFEEDKINLIPNGIDLKEYRNLPEKGIFRKKYNINPNEKVILYLGRLDKIKGIELLIDAFSKLLYDFKNVKLVIAGPDHGLMNSLKSKIVSLDINDGTVIFTGPLYDTDKLEAYVDSDVYVLPSVYETFPTTVLEACACKKPVIVTEGCNIADIIDNNCGIVVKYDKNALKTAILTLLTNDELIQKFGEAGKNLVLNNYTWDKIAFKFEKTYKKLIG